MEKSAFLKRYAALGWTFKEVRPANYLRVNTLIQKNDVVDRLKERGVVLEKVPFLDQCWRVVSSPFSLGSTIEYLRGEYYLQGAAAQLPVSVLAPKPGELVLDCCASPGGKLTQMAARMQGKGVLVAVEKKKERLGRLCNNLERLGVTNALVYHKDARNAPEFGMMFDRVLVDAPCSGNFTQEKGWFAKRSAKDFEEMSKLQKQILKSALACLKPGGTLVYSTCSLEPEEDEFVIDYAVRELGAQVEDTGLSVGVPGVTDALGRTLHKDVSKCRRIWPGGTEGFFVAKLTREGAGRSR